MFAVSRNIDLAKEVAQMEKFTLAILGGLSRYTLLNQRFSDLYNQPVLYLTDHEASIQGLLKLCDIASGKIKNLSDYHKEFLNTDAMVELEPRSTMTTKLQNKYKKWMSITKI